MYLDDILVYSETFEQHLDRLEAVFRRLAKTGLKVKLQKCAFLQKTVTFLGHKVSAEGVGTDPSNISAVKKWEVPSSVKELRSFLGFGSYNRRFIPWLPAQLLPAPKKCVREIGSGGSRIGDNYRKPESGQTNEIARTGFIR